MKNIRYARIVCYLCKKGNVTLRKCKNGMDYVCERCMQWEGLDGPEIGNQSRVYFEKEKK